MRWTIEDTPEQARFRAGFRAWLREVLEPGWVEAIDDGDEQRFAEVHAAAQANGWNFLTWTPTIGATGYGAPLWPKEYGGGSGEAWTQSTVREELSRYRLPPFGVNIVGLGLVGPTIIAHGTNAQKDRFLRKILTGEELWCQLFSEPGAGSDLASVVTRAERDGDEWVRRWRIFEALSRIASAGEKSGARVRATASRSICTYSDVDQKLQHPGPRPCVQPSRGFCETF